MSLTKVTEAFAISQTDLPTSSTALEYLDMISPKMIDETKTGKVKAKQGLTVHDMEKLTLKEKILSILLNGLYFCVFYSMQNERKLRKIQHKSLRLMFSAKCWTLTLQTHPFLKLWKTSHSALEASGFSRATIFIRTVF